MVSQLISGKRSTDFSLGGEKGGEKTGFLLQERLHLTMKKTWLWESVAEWCVQGGGNFGGNVPPVFRIVRPLQYPVPSVILHPESRQALRSVCPGEETAATPSLGHSLFLSVWHPPDPLSEPQYSHL